MEKIQKPEANLQPQLTSDRSEKNVPHQTSRFHRGEKLPPMRNSLKQRSHRTLRAPSPEPAIRSRIRESPSYNQRTSCLYTDFHETFTGPGGQKKTAKCPCFWFCQLVNRFVAWNCLNPQNPMNPHHVAVWETDASHGILNLFVNCTISQQFDISRLHRLFSNLQPFSTNIGSHDSCRTVLPQECKHRGATDFAPGRKASHDGHKWPSAQVLPCWNQSTSPGITRGVMYLCQICVKFPLHDWVQAQMWACLVSLVAWCCRLISDIKSWEAKESLSLCLYLCRSIARCLAHTQLLIYSWENIQKILKNHEIMKDHEGTVSFSHGRKLFNQQRGLEPSI